MFTWIFGLLKGLFGDDMYDFMRGYQCETDAFTGQNLCQSIGLYVAIAAFVLFGVFYYILRNPRLAKASWWFVTLCVVGGISMLLGYLLVHIPFASGQIPDCLMYYDPAVNGEEGDVVQLIYDRNCWGVGIGSGGIGIVLFFLFSMLGKRWSKYARYIPFKTL